MPGQEGSGLSSKEREGGGGREQREGGGGGGCRMGQEQAVKQGPHSLAA